MVQDSDICCPQGYCSLNNTVPKMQIQGITAKNFSHPEESKTKDLKSAPLRDNIVEPANKEDK